MSTLPFAPAVLKHVFAHFQLYRHKYFSNRIICYDNFFHAPPSAVPAIPKDDIFVDIYTFGDIYTFLSHRP